MSYPPGPADPQPNQPQPNQPQPQSNEPQPNQPPPAPQYAPPAYPQQPGYPPPGYAQTPAYGVPAPTHGKATTSLVLGIVSLVLCGLLAGIPAMILARQAKREIAESGGRLSGDGVATAGFWTGLIGTVLSALGILALIGLIAFAGNEIQQACTTNPDGSISCSRT